MNLAALELQFRPWGNREKQFFLSRSALFNKASAHFKGQARILNFRSTIESFLCETFLTAFKFQAMQLYGVCCFYILMWEVTDRTMGADKGKIRDGCRSQRNLRGINCDAL
jgi:hypothetical protein